MAKAKISVKKATTKVKTTKRAPKAQGTSKTKAPTTMIVKTNIFIYIMQLIFWLIALPFHLIWSIVKIIYNLVFRMPASPAPIKGLLRLGLFVWIGFQYDVIKSFIETNQYTSNHSVTLIGIVGLIILARVIISLGEVLGFHDSKGFTFYRSGSEYRIPGTYDNINEILDYRNTLCEARHTPGKVEEMRKTGFISKARLSQLGSEPALDETLEYVNTMVGCKTTPGGYEYLKGLFGGGNK
jgi:hypothetical protein